MRYLFLYGFALLYVPAVCAQSVEDLEDEDPSMVSFDRVLVAPIQSRDEERRGLAMELTRALEDRIASHSELVDVAEVPDFDDYGYTANVYMQACPEGQYAGCAMVVGKRANTEWVVGASIETMVDPKAGEAGIYSMTVHVVDVTGSQELLRFAVSFQLGEKDAVLEGVVKVFGEVLKGAYDPKDMREDSASVPMGKGLSPEQEKAVVDVLADLEGLHGAVERRTPKGVLQEPRFTKADLDPFRDREDGTPWDRVGLTEDQYLRYRNAQMSLIEFKERARGPQGSLVFRVEGGAGGGPYHGDYVGMYARQYLGLDAVGDVVERSEVYQVDAGMMGFARLEVGLGLTPNLEVGWSTRLMSVQVTTFEDEQVVDQPNPAVDPKQEGRSASEQGIYAKFLAWPDRGSSPTLRVGASRWIGPTPKLIDEELTPPSLPTQTLIQVSPGFVVRALPALDVHAGLGLDLGVGAGKITCLEGRGAPCREVQEYNYIIDAPSEQSVSPLGWSLGLGFSARLGIWGRAEEDSGPRKLGFEDEWMDEDL